MVLKDPIPSEWKVNPTVWSMKQKKNSVGEITEWKSILSAGGHKSIEGLDYWETYFPVVSWSTVRLVLYRAIMTIWHIKLVDFVQAFSQAPVKIDAIIRPPRVPHNFLITNWQKITGRFKYIYQLFCNLYDLNGDSKAWNDYLNEGLQGQNWK